MRVKSSILSHEKSLFMIIFHCMGHSQFLSDCSRKERMIMKTARKEEEGLIDNPIVEFLETLCNFDTVLHR